MPGGIAPVLSCGRHGQKLSRVFRRASDSAASIAFTAVPGVLVVLGLPLLTRRLRDEADEAAPHVTAGDRPAPGRLPLHKLVPWFIVGLPVLAGLRSADVVRHVALGPMATAANLLTTVPMAALGLGTDLRVVVRAGTRVIAAVTLSLLALGAISLELIRLPGIA